MDLSGNILVTPELGPPPPDVLTLADLLNDQTIVQSKEQQDKQQLETIWTQKVEVLRPKLREWVLKGQTFGFPLISLDIQPPSRCSDGEVRDLTEYIQFCSGKSIEEHVGLLQSKLPDIRLSFANIQGKVSVIIV